MHYTSSSQARCCQFSLFFSDLLNIFRSVGFHPSLFLWKNTCFFADAKAGGTMSARCWVALGIWPSDPMQGRQMANRGRGVSTDAFLWVEDSESPWFLWCFYDGRILGPVGIRCILRSRKFTKVVGWFLRCWMYGFQICAKGIFGTYGSTDLQHSHVL